MTVNAQTVRPPLGTVGLPLPSPLAQDAVSSPEQQRLWRARLQAELTDNILPWWRDHMLAPQGGWYGGRTNSGELRDDLPRGGILGCRMLWTFAEAHRSFPGQGWDAAAQHVWQWLLQQVWDPVHGGLYWSVDASGHALQSHKHSYVQGFAIYALTAWHRSSGQALPLRMAQRCFDLIERHAHDALHGGYREGCTRAWQPMPGAALSPSEPVAAKSMNTLLHVLEGLTELLRLWPNTRLQARVQELIELFLNRVWQSESGHFGLFFDADWTLLSPHISHGHEIEASWLLVRAAEVLGEPSLLQQTRALTLTVADAVLARGLAADGSVCPDDASLHASHSAHSAHSAQQRAWWPQAEGMVGFWDAYQWHGDVRYAAASQTLWNWIEKHLVDREHGDWLKSVGAHGSHAGTDLKAGPWDCPYHHARACMEMAQRLEAP